MPGAWPAPINAAQGRGADDEEALTGNIVALARQFGRYGGGITTGFGPAAVLATVRPPRKRLLRHCRSPGERFGENDPCPAGVLLARIVADAD
jgi:hypothetical protein